MIKKTIYGVLMAACLCAGAMSSAEAADNIQTFVEFSGEIVDQDAINITAVLPLEFRIYSAKNAKKALSTEKHFVSVVDGKYDITLGDAVPLSSAEPELYVAVLLDGKELTRQKVAAKRHIVDTITESRVTQTKFVKLSDKNDGEFSLNCPKGYVVTGIEGRRVNGQMDSLRLICSNVF